MLIDVSGFLEPTNTYKSVQGEYCEHGLGRVTGKIVFDEGDTAKAGEIGPCPDCSPDWYPAPEPISCWLSDRH